MSKELKHALAFVELCCTHYGGDEQARHADRFIEEHAEAIEVGLRVIALPNNGQLQHDRDTDGHGTWWATDTGYIWKRGTSPLDALRALEESNDHPTQGEPTRSSRSDTSSAA